MVNSRTNSYSKNNYSAYTGMNPVVSTTNYYINSNPNALPKSRNYYAQYMFKNLLTGADTAGNVYINPEYNVSKESPGISWTL